MPENTENTEVGTSVSLITDIQQDPLTFEYQLLKSNSFSASWNVSLAQGDRILSETMIALVEDSGITYSTQNVSGIFLERLTEPNPPLIYYIDINNNLLSVEKWSELPLPSDPNFKCLVDYKVSTIKTETVSYTHTLLYETIDESLNLQEKTILTALTINIKNNWDSDKNKVSSTTSNSSGKPIGVLGSSTSGHATFPPTVSVSASNKVFINGKGALRDGDGLAPHTSVAYPYPTHQGSIVGGSSKVFIEGKKAVRIGDSTSCGGAIAQGESKVLCS